MLSLKDGSVNDSSILDIIPSIIDRKLAGLVTPLNELDFLVSLASREEVKQVCKMGTFRDLIKDGSCSLKLAPWSAELGAS